MALSWNENKCATNLPPMRSCGYRRRPFPARFRLISLGVQLNGSLLEPARADLDPGKFWESLRMTESDLDKLWSVVPVGEANAAAASKIWKRLDMWTRPTIQHKLRWLADAGRIHRVSRPMPMGGVVRLYYR
jgi:predicted transcriptional regulator